MRPHSEHQFYIQVESFLPADEENSKKNFQLRPIKGQAYPPTTRIALKNAMAQNHPLGTRFKITAQVQDDQNGLGEYLMMPDSFPYEIVY